MAGIGERMEGAGEIVFGPDGYPVSMDGGPVPDDETLERFRRQSEYYGRQAGPNGRAGPNAPRVRLIWKNRPEGDGADSGE